MDVVILKSAKRRSVPEWEFKPMATNRDIDILINAGSSFTVHNAQIEPREIGDLHRDPEVAAIAPVMPIALIEPMETAQPAPENAVPKVWGLEAVKAVESPRTGDGVKVAILDTGIDPTHAAFGRIGNMQRRNFTSESDDDTHGHGTHCAATIFGRDVDGQRIGIARGVEHVLVGKVLGAGGGSTATLVNAVNWAVENGAHIISMSLGFDFIRYRDEFVQRGMPERQAVSMALAGYRDNVRLFDTLSKLVTQNPISRSVLLVAATGNESDRRNAIRIAPSPPAVGEGFIAVGALAPASAGSFELANFSNAGARFVAPGVDILSARRGGGLTLKSGTSMATPHVAGIAALWAEDAMRRGRPVNARSLLQALLDSRRRLDNLSTDDAGDGMVQAPS